MAALFVVDNSVVMSWCFMDEENSYADGVLEKLANSRALVPQIWPLEVVNVLLVAERKNRITEAGSRRFITLLSQLPICVEQDEQTLVMKDLLPLARANALSSYDASYLNLAMSRGVPLATLDKKLLEAARHVHVPVLAI